MDGAYGAVEGGSTTHTPSFHLQCLRGSCTSVTRQRQWKLYTELELLHASVSLRTYCINTVLYCILGRGHLRLASHSHQGRPCSHQHSWRVSCPHVRSRLFPSKGRAQNKSTLGSANPSICNKSWRFFDVVYRTWCSVTARLLSFLLSSFCTVFAVYGRKTPFSSEILSIATF